MSTERTYRQRGRDGVIYYLPESAIGADVSYADALAADEDAQLDATVNENAHRIHPDRVAALAGVVEENRYARLLGQLDPALRASLEAKARANVAALTAPRAEAVLPNRGHLPHIDSRAVAAAGGHAQDLVTGETPRRVWEWWTRAPDIAKAVVGAVLVAAIIFAGGVADANKAHALAVPMQKAPVTVVVAGRTTPIRMTAASTVPGAMVALWAQTGPVAIGYADPGGWANLSGNVPTSRLVVGAGQRWELYDGSEPVTAVTVDVLRQSKVTANPAVGYAGGFLITGWARHYDVASNTYKGDLNSDVQVQVAVGKTWKTVQTVRTAPDGSVRAVVPYPTGKVYVRLVRQRGTSVSGAVSAVRSTIALPALAGGTPASWEL